MTSLRRFALLFVLAMTLPAQAGLIVDRLHDRDQRPAATDSTSSDWSELGGGGLDLPCAQWKRVTEHLQRRAGNRLQGPVPDLKDVAYGPEKSERLDVFLPAKDRLGTRAPILVMVHGGGWCVGDKTMPGVTTNKVARWVAQGFLFVSVNYPMVADGRDALAQARHVAKAVAFVQDKAEGWGGDPARLILMGHSAGAHLVSLVNADAGLRGSHRLRPLLGVVSLDSGAVDVVRQMPRVYPFLRTRYREAFGETEAAWLPASPFHVLGPGASPWLGVCSTTRKDDPCAQAQAYADKSNGLGVRAAVLPVRKSHKEINEELGRPGEYTEGVEAFMASLDPLVSARLKKQPAQAGLGDPVAPDR